MTYKPLKPFVYPPDTSEVIYHSLMEICVIDNYTE